MTTTRPAIEYHYKCHCGVIHYGVRYHAVMKKSRIAKKMLQNDTVPW
jgi:hypothetical protein